jgi:diguanylate cyclase (GGDEF)-like protein
MSNDSRPLILIVDDAPTNLQVLAQALRESFRIKVATSGADALRIAAGPDRPTLILLDIMMPEMDGYETCRRLKQDELTSDIPIIFATALDEPQDEERGLELGAVDYVVKPYRIPIVKVRIRNQVDLKLKTDILRSQAVRDGLTGIANRRAFDSALDRMVRHAARHARPIAVVMADIDYFKEFNDQYGHLAGDECLKAVAEALTKVATRSSDVVARYGGEEFGVVLPETDREGALVVAEHMRLAVSALSVPHARSKAESVVTISLGVSVEPKVSGQEMLATADRCLYAAKSQGRNRVCID